MCFIVLKGEGRWVGVFEQTWERFEQQQKKKQNRRGCLLMKCSRSLRLCSLLQFPPSVKPATLQMTVFMVVAPCCLVYMHRRFGQTFFCHVQDICISLIDDGGYVSLNCRYIFTRPHDVTPHKTVLLIVISIRASKSAVTPLRSV